MERNKDGSSIKKISRLIRNASEDDSAYVIGVDWVNEYLNNGCKLVAVSTATQAGATNGITTFIYKIKNSNNLIPDLHPYSDIPVIKIIASEPLLDADNIYEVAEAIDNGTHTKYTNNGWFTLLNCKSDDERTKYSFGKKR